MRFLGLPYWEGSSLRSQWIIMCFHVRNDSMSMWHVGKKYVFASAGGWRHRSDRRGGGRWLADRAVRRQEWPISCQSRRQDSSCLGIILLTSVVWIRQHLSISIFFVELWWKFIENWSYFWFIYLVGYIETRGFFVFSNLVGCIETRGFFAFFQLSF